MHDRRNISETAFKSKLISSDYDDLEINLKYYSRFKGKSIKINTWY